MKQSEAEARLQEAEAALKKERQRLDELQVGLGLLLLSFTSRRCSACFGMAGMSWAAEAALRRSGRWVGLQSFCTWMLYAILGWAVVGGAEQRALQGEEAGRRNGGQTPKVAFATAPLSTPCK